MSIAAVTWTALRETGLDHDDPYWVVRDSIVHHTFDGRPYLGLVASLAYESDDPDVEAKARLMAASKDLLEVCEEARAMLENIGQSDYTLRLAERLDAVIGKARGDA